MAVALDAIRAAGGVSVLAHPGLLPEDKIDPLIQKLIGMGLDGIEAYYPRHSTAQTGFLMDIAKKNNLVITGGTDFHGRISPEIKMGSGLGDFHIPYAVYESLVDKINLNSEITH